MNPSVLVEICTDNLQDTIHAMSLGADRIELCSNLDQDGLTPSTALLEKSIELGQKYGVEIFPMIRCRGENFVYSQEEKRGMVKDAVRVVELGSDGIVVGALTLDGRVDLEFIAEIASAVRKINPLIHITFHKAIDIVSLRDGESLAMVIDSLAPYCDRVLTSGHAATAIEGAHAIREIGQRPIGFPTPLAAGKIRSNNVHEVIAITGAKEVHSRSADIAITLGKSPRNVIT